mgnify:CR=1 FL=1
MLELRTVGMQVELFRIQNSLNYEEACAGILKFYGIVPTPIGETSKSPRYGSQEIVFFNQKPLSAKN